MQTTTRHPCPSRALLVASLAAAALGGGLLVAPSAFAGTPATTAITGTPLRGTYTHWYDFTFGTQGFTAPVTFSVASGSLPDGLGMNQDGEITGYPDVIGPGSPVLVRASDGGTDPDATLTVTVPVDNVPPSWFTPPPTTTTVAAGSSYYVQYATNYNPARVTYSISGAVPPGLTLDQYGELQGTPTTPGTYTFTVTASNGTLPDLTATSTIVVTGAAPGISGDAPDAVRGQYYDFTYTLAGVPAPTTSIVAGALPPGVNLGTDGHLTGIPSTPGTYTFTVAADNSVGPRAIDQDTIVVAPAILSLTGNPPAGSLREPYDYGFDLRASARFLTIEVPSGALPPGLRLDGAALTGTPTRIGIYRFTITVTDNYGDTTSDRVTMQVLPPPTLSVADSSAVEGDSGTSPMTFTVTLNRPSSAPVTVHWSTANGSAKAGTDYRAASGDLTFAPGQTSATLTVPLIGHASKEPLEAFTVRLSRPGDATLLRATAIGHIIDADWRPAR